MSTEAKRPNMPRPQFTLRTLFVAMLVVATFFGGRAIGIRQERRDQINELVAEQVRLRDELLSLRNRLQKAIQDRMEGNRQAAARREEILAKLAKVLEENPEARIEASQLRSLLPETRNVEKRPTKGEMLKETLDKVDGPPSGLPAS